MAPHLSSLIGFMLDCFDGGDWSMAKQVWTTAAITNDERVDVWGYLDSRQRAFLKGDDRKYLNNES